ncbi:MAG: potassium channel protein [Desulfobacterales bacterium]|nr:potassium channel protein [Desulfobacterales bacterium]
MERVTQVIISVCLSIALLALGSLGYMLIEGWGFMDSLYMTVITLATVGYGEVQTLSGPGRVFTLILIILGVGYFLYVVGAIIQFLVEGRIRLVLGRRKLDRQINKLEGHYIVCGYGRMGRALTRFLIQRYLDVVVIEQSESRVPTMNEDGVLYLLGAATDENMLMRAGIARARGIMTVVGADADNVFMVLLARELNPDIFIVSRAILNSAKRTLRAAGANKIVSPYDLGARRMAHAVLRPTVIEFLEMAFADDSADIEVEELKVKPNSPLRSVCLVDSNIRRDYNVIIITIKKNDGQMVFNPGAETCLEADDTLVVVGLRTNIRKLERMLSPP